jgi:hypothetical protein
MTFVSWLRMRTSTQARRVQAQRPSAAPRFRPRLEALEERWLPSTLTVTNNLDSGAGSLRAEIAVANNKDTIVFDNRLSGQTISLTSGELLVNKNLTIQGLGAGQLTVGNGYASRVFEIQAGATVTIAGLTIANGLADWGGGIDNAGTLTVSGCTLTGNQGGHGGGIYNSGTLTVNGCTLTGNVAGYGGGIDNEWGATVNNSTLSGNAVSGGDFNQGWGGGIYNGRAMTVNSCTFTGNTTAGAGGGIFNAGGSLTVSYCTITGNTAELGGGIYNDRYGSLKLKHSVVINNVGTGDLALDPDGTATFADDQLGHVIYT